MRKIYGMKSAICPILPDDIKVFSKRLAVSIAPVLEKYLYFVTEGLHGAETDEEGRPIVEFGKAPNENGDMFLWAELIGESPIPGKKVYETWIGKPVLENHRANCRRGEIIDTYPDDDRRSIDMLDAIDKEQFPELAEGILEGRITDTSMGVIVGWSECSVCGKKMKDVDEWCSHLRLFKGKKYPQTGEIVYELSHDLIGLEDSLITVGTGADTEAKIREILARNESIITDARRMVYAFKDLCRQMKVPPKDFVDFIAYILNERRNR